MEVSLEVEYILMVDRWRGISYICFTYMYLLLHSTIRACIEYMYVYKYVRTFIVSSDRRPPIEDVKGESLLLCCDTPRALLSHMLHSSMIADRANHWVKCEIESLFLTMKILVTWNMFRTYRNTIRLSYCPIVLQIAKQEEDSTCEIKCRSPARDVQQAILVIHVSWNNVSNVSTSKA